MPMASLCQQVTKPWRRRTGTVSTRKFLNEAFMKKIAFIGAMLLLLACSASASDRLDSAATAPQNEADIQRVMDSFHHAVAAHDGKGVSDLFLDHGSTWVTVLSDKAFAIAKSKNAVAQKIHVSSYKDFATFVSSTKSVLDPRHGNVRIMSDGAVASVYFHFDFVTDGKVENCGDETWQLVKTADGWRIVAITYSSNPEAA
jgi:ketosteroid isomerase-like protein